MATESSFSFPYVHETTILNAHSMTLLSLAFLALIVFRPALDMCLSCLLRSFYIESHPCTSSKSMQVVKCKRNVRV